MNKTKKIIIIICVIIIFIIFTILNIKNSKYNKLEDNIESTRNETKDTSVMYNENATIDDLKEEYKYTGEDDLYEIQTEYDGRKVLTVKPNINYQVAFAGMIQKAKPEYSQVSKIFEDSYPKKTGIWIEENSREKLLSLFNDNLGSNYEIDEDGYLKLVDESFNDENEEKIKNIINGDKQFILCISSVCYMVDSVTGEIVDNPFEDLEKYQTYEYFKNEDNMLIFVTENSEGELSDEEIFRSLFDLITEI
jgi:uncharacterized protein YxeA